jgi:DnaJ-class molecular chaperone
MKNNKKCPVCNGKGFMQAGGMRGRQTCGHCLGYGYIDKDIKEQSDKIKNLQEEG